MKKFKFEYRITLAYLFLGGVWIIFSDKLLYLIIENANLLTEIQTYKGWFFVFVTALIFYIFIKKHLNLLRYTEQELILSKAKLGESEKAYKDVVETSSDLITVVDDQGKILFVNHASNKIYGLSPKECIGKIAFDFLHPEDKDETQFKFEEWVNSENSNFYFENRQVSVTGKIYDIEWNIYFERKGTEIIKIISTGRDITRQNRTQQELIKAKEKAEESELTFRKIFEDSFDAILLINKTGVFKECNKAALNLLKMTREQLLFQSPQKISPEYQPSGQKSEEAATEMINLAYKKGLHRFDWTHINAEGGEFIVEVSLITIKVKGQTMLHTTWRDITERKQMESELIIAKEIAESNNANISAILEGTSNSIWAFDQNYDILYINQTFQKEFENSFGVRLERGVNLIDALPQELRPLWKPRYDKVLNNEQFTTEDAVETVNGIIYIRVTFNPIIKKSQVVGGSCMGIDISYQKLAENELLKAKEQAEESERKLLEAQELSHVGSWEYIVDTDTVAWSKELYNIFEYPYNLLPPKFSEQQKLYTEESFARLEKAVENCIQREIPYEIGLDIFTSSGSIKHIISKGKIKKENNKVVGSYGTAQDVTAQKQLELQLIQAKEKAEESEALKSAFLANMSHEIRTPMNGILGFSELLKTPNLSGENQHKYIEIIEKSGNRMLNIINDIIDISKIEAGLMKTIVKESNINEQVEYIYTFFKPEVEAKGMQLFFKNSLHTKQATIKTDREKLFAILTNLVKNAIKYSNKGSIEFGYEKKEGYIEFFVKDTGIGISKERQEAIFERFIQADIKDTMARQGAGLGLSITKAYVEMLDGKIWVESEEGIGSTFYFTLPYNEELKVKMNTKEIEVIANSENHVKNLKILIAEDDETSEMLLSLNVSEFSNEIINVRTGTEAIEACRNNPDLDLILMDIQMPSLDGHEATRQIRQFNKEVVIIAQTAFGLAGDREKSLNAGCNDYITKPINKLELDSLIHKYFKK